MNNNNRQPRLDPQQTIDEITNYIMDEFVRGKITTSDTDTDEDDEMYTNIWNDINVIIYDDGR